MIMAQYVPRLSQTTPTNIWQNPYWYSSLNGYYMRGYGLPNCTCYAYGRATELNGGHIVNGLATHGDGGQWYDLSSPNLRAGNDPRTVQLGDILVFTPINQESKHQGGHVSVVEEINWNARRPYVKVSESGYRRPLSSYPPSMDWYFHPGTHYIDEKFEGGWISRWGYYFRGILRFLSGPLTPSYPMPSSWISKSYIYDMKEPDMQNNAILIFAYLTNKGWTIEAIAAFLGNVEVESGVSPGCWGLGGANAFGLVMWTPSQNYTPWANWNDYAIDDGFRQLEFIDMGVYCHGTNADGSPHLSNTWTPNNHGINMTYSEFKSSHRYPEDLAYVFLWGYERAAGDGMIGARRRNAKKWYNFLQGIDINSIGPFITPSYASLMTGGMHVWMMAGKPKINIIY